MSCCQHVLTRAETRPPQSGNWEEGPPLRDAWAGGTLCTFSALEDFTRSPERCEQKAVQRQTPLPVDAARRRLPCQAQLCFRSLANNVLEHSRTCASCRDQHRQLCKGKVLPKMLCLGNLSIKWVSRDDTAYAFLWASDL